MAHCPASSPTAQVAASRPIDATRALLDDTAALVNGAYATALRLVIEAIDSGKHRSADGYAGPLDWLRAQFDFTHHAARNIAAIARLAKKFTVLAEAALTGTARIDQAAHAMTHLNRTAAATLFARTPFPEPVASPFDAETVCATPEALVAEYAAHAPFKVLKRHLAELDATLAADAELQDQLGQTALQALSVQETAPGGMWVVSGLLASDTGALLDKYLKTACPPPRQDETDQYGVLPAAEQRNAEALHQLLAGYGASPQAATRHGHTATLDLTVDIETLQGKDTGRLPLLEGRPISVARARLLACEAGVVPSVFDYATGEAIELGRALRLPNTALRRKLELEQPTGCAWHDCDRPLAWTEAHHVRHWADGGATSAENLILLCRFHHGRIHTGGWTVTKTGPGRALIVHHDHASAADDGDCTAGCADWRADADMDALFDHDPRQVFPTGLYPVEWTEAMAPMLQDTIDQIAQGKAYFEGRHFATVKAGASTGDPRIIEPGITTPPPGVLGERASARDPIPFLLRPPRGANRGGGRTTCLPSSGLPQVRAPRRAHAQTRPPSASRG